MKEEEGKENAIKTHGGRDTPGPINEGPSDMNLFIMFYVKDIVSSCRRVSPL